MIRNNQTLNSILCSLLIFIGTLLIPIKILFNSGSIVYMVTILLIIVFVFNNGINLRIMFHLLVISLLFLFSSAFFGNGTEVLTIYVSFLKFGFIYYWFFSGIVDINIFSKNFLIISIISSLILFSEIFILKRDINYMSMGVDLTFVLIAVVLYLTIDKDVRYKLPLILWSLVLITICIVYGNRMSAVSMILIFIYYFMSSDTSKKMYIKILKTSSLFSVLMMLLFTYKNIVNWIWNFLISRGITSYSLFKIKVMIETDNIDVVSSGRDDLYLFALETIKNNKLMPVGIGYFSANTNFLYPHNIVFELLLDFGLFAFPIIFLGIIWIIARVKKCSTNVKFLINIFLIFAFSRLLVSSSYWLEPSLWIVFGLIFSNSRREI